MEWRGLVKAHKSQWTQCRVKGWISICPKSSEGTEIEKIIDLIWPLDVWTQFIEGLILERDLSVKIKPYLCWNHKQPSACVVSWHSFIKMYVVFPHLKTSARNLRNLFSKLLILQNNQPPPCRVVPEPLLNNVGIVHLEKKNWRGLLRLSIFPFSFSPTTCLSQGMAKAHFWAQQVVVCRAWHRPKINSSYWCLFFFCFFADIATVVVKTDFLVFFTCLMVYSGYVLVALYLWTYL